MPLPPDNSVEDYMARLARELKSLPAAARDEHLRELRQHIEQLVAARAGQPDAVPLALSLMGDPVPVGQKLLREWRTNSKKMAVAFYVMLAAFAVAIGYGTIAYILNMRFAMLDFTATAALCGVLPITAACASGTVFPARALRGAFWAGFVGLGILLCVLAALYEILLPTFAPPHVFMRAGGVYHFSDTVIGLVSIYVRWWVAACVVAYIASSVKRKDWTLRLQ